MQDGVGDVADDGAADGEVPLVDTDAEPVRLLQVVQHLRDHPHLVLTAGNQEKKL